MEQEIDAWLEQLRQCKPLTESEVKKLCDKACSDDTIRLVFSSLSLSLSAGEGDIDGGIECPASSLSGDGVRGYPWSIRESSSSDLDQQR
jgi:hypothetical protein